MDASSNTSTEFLNNPVWNSITDTHAHLGEKHGQAARYLPKVSPFSALAEPTLAALEDMYQLIPDQQVAAIMTPASELPESPLWRKVGTFNLFQMIHTSEQPAAEIASIELGKEDIQAMIELVKLTEPGPFDQRTIEFGRYKGVYEDCQLIAMAGERLRPKGWVEVSGVCTHPTARGRGLAGALVQEIVMGAKKHGEQAFLNVRKGSPSENAARHVYQQMGFQVHQDMFIFALEKL